MLMLISLLAMIPGPILYGWIIDSTCLVWTYKCGRLGNCQMYDRRKFRLLMNSAGLSKSNWNLDHWSGDINYSYHSPPALTTIGVCFDFLVWYYGRTLDLYSEDYEENNKRFHKSHKGVKSAERWFGEDIIDSAIWNLYLITMERELLGYSGYYKWPCRGRAKIMFIYNRYASLYKNFILQCTNEKQLVFFLALLWVSVWLCVVVIRFAIFFWGQQSLI